MAGTVRSARHHQAMDTARRLGKLSRSPPWPRAGPGVHRAGPSVSPAAARRMIDNQAPVNKRPWSGIPQGSFEGRSRGAPTRIAVAVRCLAGRFFATRPVIAEALIRWGHILLPMVPTAIGLLILIQGGAFGHHGTPGRAAVGTTLRLCRASRPMTRAVARRGSPG